MRSPFKTHRMREQRDNISKCYDNISFKGTHVKNGSPTEELMDRYCIYSIENYIFLIRSQKPVQERIVFGMETFLYQN